jgi:hypothetical protein
VVMKSRLSLVQAASDCTIVSRLRPTEVSEYSTCGGTLGWTVRETMPSRSRLRRVGVRGRLVLDIWAPHETQEPGQ